MQLAPNSYCQMVVLLVAYKQLDFLDLTPKEFAFIYSLQENTGDHGFYQFRKWHSRDVKAFGTLKVT